jgi:hypothetical protein
MIWRGGEVGDFELRGRYRLHGDHGNSGGKIHVIGSVGDPEQLQSWIRKNDWSDFAVVAQGNRLVHKINGRVMVDVIDDGEYWRSNSIDRAR